MARYIGPKSKIERRVGERLQLKGSRSLSPKDPFLRRSYPPGMHGPKGSGRLSEYAKQLKEKQKARAIYGILERQFRKIYKKAVKSPEETGVKMLELLERRLDSVIYSSAFAASRNQARQLVNHAHIMVNNRKMSIPSYEVRVGDVITLKETSKAKTLVQENIKIFTDRECEWIDVNPELLQITVTSLPKREDIDSIIDMRQIVEFYSK